MKIKFLVLFCVALGIGLSIGCKKTAVTEEDSASETAQNIGDAMASVDESGGSGNGTVTSQLNSAEKTFARLAPEETHLSISNYLLPNAEAVTCFGNGFASCAGNVVTRTFGGCTIGVAVFNGTVNFTWTNSAGTALGACVLGTNGDRITREPNFTVTGRRGATLTVTKSGTIGQRLTRQSTGVFTLTNDGINRKFTTGAAAVLFDQTTSITTPINVSGNSRTGRVMTGGNLRVVNNITSVTCDYIPTNLTWTAGCNCPTSGNWAGSCSNGNSTTLIITGCGSADFTDGNYSGSVTLDRCGT